MSIFNIKFSKEIFQRYLKFKWLKGVLNLHNYAIQPEFEFDYPRLKTENWWKRVSYQFLQSEIIQWIWGFGKGFSLYHKRINERVKIIKDDKQTAIMEDSMWSISTASLQAILADDARAIFGGDGDRARYP